MDERIKAYETKMSKILRQSVKGVSVRSAQAVPIPMYWTRSRVDYYGTPTPLTAGGKHHRSGSSDSDDPALGEKDDP